jgi:hypothetical protein
MFQAYRNNPSAPPHAMQDRPLTTMSRESKTAFDCLAKNESQNSSSIVNFDQSLI